MSDWIPLGESEAGRPDHDEESSAGAGSEAGKSSPGDVWYQDRAGKRRGPIPPEDVAVLVEWGKLTRKTQVWSTGLGEWMAIGKTELLGGDESADPASVVGKARRTITDAAKVAGQATKRGVQKAGEHKLTQGAVAAGQAAAGGTKEAAAKAKKALEESWPKVEDAIVNKGLPLVVKGLEQDEALEMAFNRVFDALPFFIRFALPRRSFVRFCLERRSRIVDRINAARADGRVGDDDDGEPLDLERSADEPRDYLKELELFLRSDPLSQLENITLPDRPLRELLADGGGDELMWIVAASLAVPNGMTRKIAAFALGQIGDPGAIPLLEARLTEERTQDNREAIQASLEVLEELPLGSGASEVDRRTAVEMVYDGRPLGPDPSPKDDDG